MTSPATSTYLTPLHELTDRSQQWMLRAQLGEHA
jgi:hypothetical protein